MAERVRLRLGDILYMVQRLAAGGEGSRPLIVAGALLMPLALVTPPWPAATETTSAPLSIASERSAGFPRQGIVTKMSHLRLSPSMQSTIVTIAKEGTLVEILAENDQWYRVTHKAGVEAWIYKSLVRIEPEAREPQTPASTASTPPHFWELLPASATMPDISVEPSSVNIQVERETDVLPLIGVDQPTQPSEAPWSGWLTATIPPSMQGLSGYVIIGLAMTLGLSITLQLRATRQLRRAMHEIDQIVAIVEEIYAAAALPQPRDSRAPPTLRLAEAPTKQLQHPVLAFTAVERAVLDAMSDQREVQEGELGKILAEKGLAGVLLKAVIGDIVRKTGAMGLPWVDVRYVQGRYRYRLRPDAVSSLDMSPPERR
jgi:Bacterial SH3 domain